MRKLVTDFRWYENDERQEMLVEDGRVIFRGSRYPGERPSRFESCQGRRLAPTFIDSHCHIIPAGLDMSMLDLTNIDSYDGLKEALCNDLSNLDESNWCLAIHYNSERIHGGIDITKNDLDSVSSSTPIVLRHTSGHSSIANSAALRAAGFLGVESHSGLLHEQDHFRMSKALPQPTIDEMIEAVLLAGTSMRNYGICCAADMMTGHYDPVLELRAYRLASERGCPIALRMYIQWSSYYRSPPETREAMGAEIEQMDPTKCGVSGIKIFADGAFSSGTAAIYGSYAVPSPFGHRLDAANFASEGQEVSGRLNYSPSTLAEMVRTANEEGLPVAIHSIGDFATDIVLDAFDNGIGVQNRIEHAMLLSDDQIERMARLNVHCVMQPEFLNHFEGSYAKRLGPERASKLKRFRSVLDAGINLCFSSDRPIAEGNPRTGISRAIRRPEGYDQGENISEAEAIRAYTTSSAKALGIQAEMGSLLLGQAADYRIFD
jgi:predicted amidohydrolase YtcJ